MTFSAEFERRVVFRLDSSGQPVSASVPSNGQLTGTFPETAFLSQNHRGPAVLCQCKLKPEQNRLSQGKPGQHANPPQPAVHPWPQGGERARANRPPAGTS